MKTEETLTPETQPVTWGNRVATVLMIGVVWLVTLVLSFWTNRWTLEFFLSAAAIQGAYVATLGFFIALFAEHRQQQRWFRCFAWWLLFPLPGAMVSLLIVGSVQTIFGFDEGIALIYGLPFGQLFVLGLSHLGYMHIQKRKLKNGNINTAK